MTDSRKLIVVPDTHGHLQPVLKMVKYFQTEGYLHDYRLAFLGDYVDAGPEVRDLIEFYRELRPEGHIFISGNHEYVLLRMLSEWRESLWHQRLWLRLYEQRTLESYGVKRPQDPYADFAGLTTLLSEKMGERHLAFLRSLPLFHEQDDLILVHAGLLPQFFESWEKQRRYLQGYNLHRRRGPEQLFMRPLAAGKISIDFMPYQVVSGHHIRPEPLITKKRVLLDCGLCITGRLVAWISDTGRIVNFRT